MFGFHLCLPYIGYIHRQEVHDKSSSNETSIGDESAHEKELDLSNKKGNKNINNCQELLPLQPLHVLQPAIPTPPNQTNQPNPQTQPPVSPQRPESSASTVSLSVVSPDANSNNLIIKSEDSCGSKSNVTVSYTYDAFFISDGRSRRRNGSVAAPPQPEPKERARYTCTECGKHYATSSNLSRHKQTHRSPDSQLAKKCPTCSKVYVSMPALAMHVVSYT